MQVQNFEKSKIQHQIQCLEIPQKVYFL